MNWYILAEARRYVVEALAFTDRLNVNFVRTRLRGGNEVGRSVYYVQSSRVFSSLAGRRAHEGDDVPSMRKAR